MASLSKQASFGTEALRVLNTSNRSVLNNTFLHYLKSLIMTFQRNSQQPVKSSTWGSVCSLLSAGNN